MIRCHSTRRMGEQKIRISDVNRKSEPRRNTLTFMYKDTTQKEDSEALEESFDCEVHEIFKQSSETERLHGRVTEHLKAVELRV